jgi:1,4-dihydroxy-2-naphthoate octaprenyltransferase
MVRFLVISQCLFKLFRFFLVMLTFSFFSFSTSTSNYYYDANKEDMGDGDDEQRENYV